MPKSLVAVAALLISSLQAWDANALDAERSVQFMVAAGVLLPALAILLTRDVRVRGVAVLAAAVLMVLARVVSAQHMPALALAAVFPAMLILLDHVRTLAGQKGTAVADRVGRK